MSIGPPMARVAQPIASVVEELISLLPSNNAPFVGRARWWVVGLTGIAVESQYFVLFS